MKKKKEELFIPKGNKPNAVQSIQLALAFVGEHKELFEKWIESKGGKVCHDD